MPSSTQSSSFALAQERTCPRPSSACFTFLLAAAGWKGVPLALWGAVLVVVVGSLGLVANYRKITHEKSLEHAILAVNAVIVILTILALRA